MSLILVPICALIDDQGHLFLSRRQPHQGYLEFPGGKVENNETPTETLIREMKEELGIIVQKEYLQSVGFAVHDYNKPYVLLLMYVCRQWQGTPTGIEGQEIVKIPIQELENHIKNMPPANIEFVPLLLKKLKELECLV
jgi:8-oxo-dGTP diphosphatase